MTMERKWGGQMRNQTESRTYTITVGKALYKEIDKLQLANRLYSDEEHIVRVLEDALLRRKVWKGTAQSTEDPYDEGFTNGYAVGMQYGRAKTLEDLRRALESISYKVDAKAEGGRHETGEKD